MYSKTYKIHRAITMCVTRLGGRKHWNTADALQCAYWLQNFWNIFVKLSVNITRNTVLEFFQFVRAP